MTKPAQKPQPVAAAATGALAIVAIWAWNQYQMVEHCSLQGDPALMECALVPDRLFLANEIYASVVLLITAITGPLIRKFMSWSSNGHDAAILEAIERLERLEKKIGKDET